MTTEQLLIGWVHVRLKIERYGIHAIPLIRRRRTIIEYVAQMRVTPPASNLCSHHPVALVDYILRSPFTYVVEKARPTTTAMKLRV